MAGILAAISSANHLSADAQKAVTGQEARTVLVAALVDRLDYTKEQAEKLQFYIDIGVIAVTVGGGGYKIAVDAKRLAKGDQALVKLNSNAAKSVDDILKPNGDFIGTVNKGATPNIRTVSLSEFNTLKDDLLDGATASGTYAGGKGTWYDLQNGGRVGVRTSDNSGLTLDIDIPGYPKGFKVHLK